jgi:glycosyltransferase involved in cell wall biosynthesis
VTTVTRHPLVIDTGRRVTDRLAECLPFRARPTASKLRILHVSFSSRIGGSERYCIDLANQQAALGYDVHVAGLPGSLLAEGLANNIQFHAIPLPILRATQLSRLIGKWAIDVAHAHSGSACEALGRVAGPVRKVATLYAGYKARQHSRMDGVICVNARQTSWLSGYQGRVQVVSEWLPTAALNASLRLSVRAMLGLSVDTLIVGTAGPLQVGMGGDFLIQAFREVAPAKAVLLFLGEGRQRKALEKLREADGRVHFLGARHDVASFIKGLDLFVSPSREESFGLGIIEAMGAGLPVIATKTDGPMEYLKNQPVTLVEPGSVSALRTALSNHMRRPVSSPIYDLRAFDPEANLAKVMAFYIVVVDNETVNDAGCSAAL